MLTSGIYSSAACPTLCQVDEFNYPKDFFRRMVEYLGEDRVKKMPCYDLVSLRNKLTIDEVVEQVKAPFFKGRTVHKRKSRPYFAIIYKINPEQPNWKNFKKIEYFLFEQSRCLSGWISYSFPLENTVQSDVIPYSFFPTKKLEKVCQLLDGKPVIDKSRRIARVFRLHFPDDNINLLLKNTATDEKKSDASEKMPSSSSDTNEKKSGADEKIPSLNSDAKEEQPLINSYPPLRPEERNHEKQIFEGKLQTPLPTNQLLLMLNS